MRAIIIMFATYSRIPMPRVKWEEKSRRRAICAFGLVGVVIGVLLLGLLRAGGALGIPSAALSCLVIAVPVLVTGGIHLDGFIDTSDARASYADKEEKLRILKDPHVGAFGIIRLLLYLLLVFAGIETLITRQMSGRLRLAAVLIPVLSRICSGLLAQLLPKARKSGMLTDMIGEKCQKDNVIILTAELILTAVLLGVLLLPGAPAAAVLLAAAQACLAWHYRRMALREFGGVTGDLAGWYLCMSELAGIWAYVIAGWIV